MLMLRLILGILALLSPAPVIISQLCYWSGSLTAVYFATVMPPPPPQLPTTTHQRGWIIQQGSRGRLGWRRGERGVWVPEHSFVAESSPLIGAPGSFSLLRRLFFLSSLSLFFCPGTFWSFSAFFFYLNFLFFFSGRASSLECPIIQEIPPLRWSPEWSEQPSDMELFFLFFPSSFPLFLSSYTLFFFVFSIPVLFLPIFVILIVLSGF